MAKRAKRDLKQSEETIDSSVPLSDSKSSPPSKKSKTSPAAAADDDDVRFIGKPVPADQARAKWPHRYECKVHFSRITFIRCICVHFNY